MSTLDTKQIVTGRTAIEAVTRRGVLAAGKNQPDSRAVTAKSPVREQHHRLLPMVGVAVTAHTED